MIAGNGIRKVTMFIDANLEILLGSSGGKWVAWVGHFGLINILLLSFFFPVVFFASLT